MKKYIRIDENNIVTYIHYQPFDSLFGLKKTEEELLLGGGYLVDEIPVAENIPGKRAILKYTPGEDGKEGTFSFDYAQTPVVDDSVVGERVSALETMLNFLIEDGGVEFDADENGLLRANLVPYIDYIAAQINNGTLDYNTIITKYPNIKENLDAVL